MIDFILDQKGGKYATISTQKMHIYSQLWVDSPINKQ